MVAGGAAGGNAMRIARVVDAAGTGSELALVQADGATIQRTGIAEPLEALLDPAGRARLAAAAAAAEPLDPACLLAPLLPRLVVGAGLNYRAHAAEQGRPLPATPPLFAKNPRSIAAPFQPLPPHPASAWLDYEAELGIVIGRALFDADEPEAEAAIAGFVVAQDYTLRDLARPETLTIAKGGPAMAPIGPWLTTTDAMPLAALGAARIRCRVNGELRQDSPLSDMHIGPVALVARISRHLLLGPGDLVLTGSPGGSGVGFDPPRWLGEGDSIESEIDGLGVIRQQVLRNS